MIMHKVDDEMEAGAIPSKELIAEMGQLIGEMKKSGALLAGDGLRPSATRVRLTFSGGERTVTRGPFKGSNELVAGFAAIKAKSMDEAIEWATRYAAALGDVELEVGPVTEPWDLGLGKRPEGEFPTRFLVLRKADKHTEAGLALSPKRRAAVGELLEEMTRAGVLLAVEGLAPSAKGARLKFAGGRRTVLDGPFTESKELIAGFVMIQVGSKDEAIEWAGRYAAILGTVELDVLQVSEALGDAGEGKGG
jgi:hypothetical protein